MSMPTETGATDLMGAAALLTGRMQEERKTPTDEQPPETEAKQEPEETLEGDKPKNDTDQEPERYTVKVDGQEQEVTLEELKKGFMMEANYRNKTTALNKEREALETKVQDIDKQLEDARLLIEDALSNLQSDDMQTLKSEDPEAYIKAEEEVRKKVKRFEETKAKKTKSPSSQTGQAGPERALAFNGHVP